MLTNVEFFGGIVKRFPNNFGVHFKVPFESCNNDL